MHITNSRHSRIELFRFNAFSLKLDESVSLLLSVSISLSLFIRSYHEYDQDFVNQTTNNRRYTRFIVARSIKK